MAPDFYVRGDTRLDASGFQRGLNDLAGAAVKGLAVVAGTLSAVGGYAVKVGSDFEAGMSEVAAISGAAGDDLQQLEQRAREMGASTKFSASESAEALKYMAMAGWETAAMLDGIEGVMNLAAASGESLAATSDIVTDALTAFGLTAVDSTHFSDVLAAASASANTNVALMGETFKYVGTMAGALGYDITDTALAVGLMANAGLKGSLAGTSLNAMLSRLSTNTGHARDAVEALGVSFFDESGNARALGDVMARLRQATAGMSDEQKVALANTIAGIDGQKGLLAILNASQEDYDKLAGAVANADGAAADMAATMQDNLPGALTQLSSAAEGLGISIYEHLQQPLRDAAGQGLAWIDALADGLGAGGLSGMAEALGGVLADAVTYLAALAPDLAAAALTLVWALGRGLVENAPQLAGAALQLVQELAGTLADALPQLRQAGLGLLDGLAAGMAQNIPNLLAQALPMLAGLTGGLREHAGEFVDAGLNLILQLARGLVNGLPGLIAYVPAIVTNIAGIINDNAPKLLAAGLQLVWMLISGILQNIPNLIAHAGEIVTAVVAVISAMNWLDLGQRLLTGIINGIKSLGSSLVATAKGLFTQALQAVKSINWTDLGKNVLTRAINGIKALGSLLIGALKTRFTDALGAVKRIDWKALGKSVLQGIVNGIKAVPGLVADALLEIMGSAVDAVKSFFGIHSPSTLMRDEVGRMLPRGIAVGVEADADTALSALHDLSDRMVAQAQLAVASDRIAAADTLRDSRWGAPDAITAAERQPDGPQPAAAVTTNLYQTVYTHDSLSPSELSREGEDFLERSKWKIP